MRRRNKTIETGKLHGDFEYRVEHEGKMTVSINAETTQQSDFTPKMEAIADELIEMGLSGTPELPLQLSIFHVQNGKMAPVDPLTVASVNQLEKEGATTVKVIIYHKTWCRYLSSGADTPCRCDPGVRAKPPRRDE